MAKQAKKIAKAVEPKKVAPAKVEKAVPNVDNIFGKEELKLLATLPADALVVPSAAGVLIGIKGYGLVFIEDKKIVRGNIA